jgi:hypothetical protein
MHSFKFRWKMIPPSSDSFVMLCESFESHGIAPRASPLQIVIGRFCETVHHPKSDALMSSQTDAQFPEEERRGAARGGGGCVPPARLRSPGPGAEAGPLSRDDLPIRFFAC